jgi:hypothetical protein
MAILAGDGDARDGSRGAGPIRALRRLPSLFGESARGADVTSMRLLPARRLALLAATALAAGALACTSIASAADVGVNVMTSTGFSAPKVTAALRASKPAWVRVFMVWSVLEPQQGVYYTQQIQQYQHFFKSLPAGTKVDVDVVGSPAWANGGSSSIATPPLNDADYGSFVSYLVNAFHGRVNAWEIWNEEASPNWWTGTPAQFAGLLAAAYPAVKSADPNAIVILGANDPTFLSALYADGAKNNFDAVAVHTDTACDVTSPYVYEYNQNTTVVNQYFFLGFTGTHALMAANGDGAKPIYMTEIGWSTTPAECTTGAWAGQKLAGVTPQVQATYLQQAYHCLAQPQFSYVKAAMWFELYNVGTTTDQLDNYGLLNADFSPKPSFDAFEQESLNGDQLTAPCGDFHGPAIRILHPAPGQRYSGKLRVAVAASSPANGVRWIRIRLSKNTLVQFVSKTFPANFSGSLLWGSAAKLKPGPHWITVTVTDKLGNMSTARIRIWRVKTTHYAKRHQHLERAARHGFASSLAAPRL